MIRVFFDSADNQYSPNAGKCLHLVNQPGQDNFKLDGHVFAASTDPGAYTATWNVRQELLDPAGSVVSSIVKDVPVTIPDGQVLDLSPVTIGSLPMKSVDTVKKSYRYRVCIKKGEEVISDTETGVAFNGTNTVFDAPTVPFDAGGGVVLEGATDATPAIVAEIKQNDAKLATVNTEIADLNKQIPLKQAIVTTLIARNRALKAVPGVVAA